MRRGGLLVLALVALVGCSPDVLAIDDALEQQRAKDDVPGVAVVVRREGEVLLEAALGVASLDSGADMTVHSPVHVGSLTKVFTAVLVLQEVERGTWALDDPIADWVDGVPGGEARTLRGLLSHTSGLGDFVDSEAYGADSNREWPHDEALAETFAVEEPSAEGARWSYSNGGYVLLGLALEEATGATWEDLVAERITEPLGLVDTGVREDVVPIDGYDRDEEGVVAVAPSWHSQNTWAGGALVSTAWDLALFAEAMHDDVLLSESLSAVQRERVRTEGGIVQRYGLGVGVDPIRDKRRVELGLNVGHQGRSTGHAASMSWRTYEGLELAVTLNQRSSGGRRFEKVVIAPIEGALQHERGTAVPVMSSTGWW